MTGLSSAVPTAESTPPTGTISEILAWVDDDPAQAQARAQAAYDDEAASASPRTTLLAQLQARGAVD